MKLLLTMTLALNFALAGWIGLQLSRPRAGMPMPESPAAESKTTPRRFTRTHTETDLRVLTNNVVEKFRWHQIESIDYKSYIQNLRVIGCPEETIRDIIIADVDKLYAPRLAAFRPAPEEYQFWKTGNNPGSSYNQTAEQRKQSRDIYQEKQALLKELLGEDYQKEMARQLGHAQEEDPFMAGLPKEKKDQAQKIQREFSEKRSEIYAKAKGYISMEVQDDLKVLSRQMNDELAKVLTPQELFEYQVRTSETASNLKNNELRVFDATEEEFRAIFKAKQARDLIQRSADGSIDRASRDLQRQIDDELRSTLGEQRIADYGRAQDGDYQNLVRLAETRELPRSTADKIYAMKDEADKAARAIRGSKDLTGPQRTEALAAIRAEAERAITQELGERNFNAYRRNAYWLRNIAPRNSP
jgi:hypothetical protein